MACVKYALLETTSFGEVSEWSKEHAWKVCVPHGTEGSNPSLTAISFLGIVRCALLGVITGNGKSNAQYTEK